MSYEDFLRRKLKVLRPSGFVPDTLAGPLFPHQDALSRWAIKRGRAAIFADTGLGKTRMELAWADAINRHTGRQVVILTPLAVAAQTLREAGVMGLSACIVREPADQTAPICICNYERMHKLDVSRYAGVVLDESSIIKHHTAKTLALLIETFGATPYKLCATATPAPNDWTELGNHAEFLGICTRSEMLSEYFVHDGGETQVWRIKGHARGAFWRWVSSWGAMVQSPADLGFDATAYALPPLRVREHRIEAHAEAADGALFALEAATLTERRAAKRGSLEARVEACAAMVNSDRQPWVVWCDLNDESDALVAAIPDAVEIRGAMDSDEKERRILDFIEGRARVIVTKASITGWGLNWQHCARMAFVGINDSYEGYYQAVRRCWRFGQSRSVHVELFVGVMEGSVLRNLQRKEQEAKQMATELARETHDAVMAEVIGQQERETNVYAPLRKIEHDRYTLMHGDCVEAMATLDAESVDYSVFSPPFSSLYTYSNSPRDIGNCRSDAEFFEHMSHVIAQLRRVVKPGRNVSFHCMLLPTSKERDGYIGLRDFRGDLIRAFQSAGFIYASEVCIWKDPVTAMQRTKALGLLHKTVRGNAAMSRQGIPDYLVTMRAPGECEDRVTHGEDYPVDKWQRVASPVWTDIDPSDTLQFRSAREHDDERHICPLQLEVIRRGIDLWTNPGDLVLSPFMGIGSEGYVALEMGRRFVGAELKASYFRQAEENLRGCLAQGDLLGAIA